MPTVAADGTISYNSKPIAGIYIGGDNLLDDKYSIAAGAIPNAVVDKVQVIDDHQPIRVLRQKVSSNEIVLNLELKDKAKPHPLGEESIGAGLPGDYNAELDLLLLTPAYKGINYVKTNNTGDDLQRELTAYNASALSQRTGDTPPAELLSLGSVGNPDLSRKRYFFNHSALLNTNNLVNLKNDLQLRVNAYYFHDRQIQDYQQHSAVYLPGDTVQYTATQHNRFLTELLHAQFTVNQNRGKYYLNNVLTIDDGRSQGYSDMLTNGTALHQVLNDHTSSFSDEFNLIRALRSKNIIEGYAYVSRFAQPQSRTISPGYDANLFNNGIPYAQLAQDASVPGRFGHGYFSFKVPGRLITQSFKAGVSLQSQALHSDLSILQTGNSSRADVADALNQLDWSRQKYYTELSYDIPEGQLTGNVSLPFSFQQLHYSDTGFGTNQSIGRFYFTPHLRLKYKIGKEHYLSLLYNYSNEPGSVGDVYRGNILTDYRTLQAGSSRFVSRQQQWISGGFTYRKTLSLFFFNAGVSYYRSKAGSTWSSVVTSDIQQRILLTYPGSNDSWTANTLSKYAFALRTTFGGAFQ